MSKMRLLRYRVEKFKSIMDSGWIDCDNVTTLVGVNEAGKSNLLLALWKLNLAKGGEINFADDMPVKLFSELRDEKQKPKFIHALFNITDSSLLNKISELSGFKNTSSIDIVELSRDYDGNLFITFPKANAYTTYDTQPIRDNFIYFQELIESMDEAGKTETGIKKEAQEKFITAFSILDSKEKINKSDADKLANIFTHISVKNMQKSHIRPILENAKSYLYDIKKGFEIPNPAFIKAIQELIINNIPKFVYYSNYGNLDSEIYLPHVIENMVRTDLTGVTEAKARTLKVLFEYVRLNPKEILEMGEDAKGPLDGYGRPTREPTENEIKEKAERKKERDILLQSASSKLTRDFREWWNQGNYTFDFSADGKHFRIWVADEVRPERIVLENRSTGLQWFLSFYLVFLVESKDTHSGAILLLDEAGLSLHPLAQKDLSAFFSNLSSTNQIINTTHSPFIIDTNHIDRAKVVYVDKNGYTVASNDLRAAEGELHTNSVYAVHAALGLSVSDILLQGCTPVIVEGPSDQYYFNAIKLFLINRNLIAPKDEIVFVPSGGVRAIGSLSSILSSKNELPYVIIDSDRSGQDFYDKLKKNLYKDDLYRIITVREISTIENSEVEDLIPYNILQRPIDRLFNIDLEFSTQYDYRTPIIPQIEDFALKNGVVLNDGYKVDLARQFKQSLMAKFETFNDEKYINMWKEIFDQIINNTSGN